MAGRGRRAGIVERGGDVVSREGDVDLQRREQDEVETFGCDGESSVEPALSEHESATDVVTPSVQERTRGRGLRDIAELLQQAAQILDLASAQKPKPVDADEPRRVLSVASGKAVGDGLAVVAVRLEPCGGALVELGEPLGYRLVGLESEQVS